MHTPFIKDSGCNALPAACHPSKSVQALDFDWKSGPKPFREAATAVQSDAGDAVLIKVHKVSNEMSTADAPQA
jgi:hypothetical protein